jgi:ketosteroid isomerase-like protein
MKKMMIFFGLLLLFSGAGYAGDKTSTINDNKNIAIVKEMFSEFAEKLDMNKFDGFYTKNFVLESNGKRYSHEEYKNIEHDIFQTLKRLRVVRYNDIFCASNKVVSRMTIKLVHKNGKINEFQVILIALIKNGKIDKIWELTYPSWSDKLSITGSSTQGGQ